MSQYSPYESPQSPGEFGRPPYNSGPTPGVITWYTGYCLLMAVLYFACSVGGVFLLQLDPLELGDDADAMAIKLQGYVLLVVGPPLLILFAVAPFLPRRRWAWIVGFVTIGLGMTSVCCLPATIPLLIFWINPKTKAYFVRSRPY